MVSHISETRTEDAARELLAIRGWDTARPPKGNLVRRNEYHDYPFLTEALSEASKSGAGRGYPDFIVVDPRQSMPLMVGEAKASRAHLNAASSEARGYASAFTRMGINVLAVGVAGSVEDDIAVRVQKHHGDHWKSVSFRNSPIEWIPTPDETQRLLLHPDLLILDPEVPPVEILESKAEEINRILRECRISDARRPAAVAAFMLGFWSAQGQIRIQPEHVLHDINSACQKAFKDAGKHDLVDTIILDAANDSLANQAHRILRTLRLLNVTTLSGAHDYLGQLYEHFFRFAGGNTIGQFFTPRHITRFMAEICEVTENDVVVDPSCGTGGFLIASLYRMMGNRNLTQREVRSLVKDRLWGFESEPITAGLCIANMILRGDGTSGVIKGDCFTDPRYPINKADVSLVNPPFPHAGSDEQPEKFVDRALESLHVRGEAAVIVPASMLVKGGVKRAWRKLVLRKNTLRAVIKLPDELFLPYAATNTNIAVLVKGIPHKASDRVFFARVENDGFRIKKNVRIAQAGEQLSSVLDAFKTRKELAGWFGWKPIAQDDDWSPGAYIESSTAVEADIRRAIDEMLRSDAALHAKHAAQLSIFYRRIQARAVHSKKYSDIAAGRGFTLHDEPNLLGNYFTIFYGQRALHSKEWLEDGDSLIVSSSGEYNGCYGFFDFDSLIAPPFATVPSTGSIGVSFVQRLPCGVTDDCLILVPKKNVPAEALYIAAAVVRLERWRFSYGRKITAARIARFMMPINDALIDWIKRRWQQTEVSGRQIVEAMADEKGSAEDVVRLLAEWERKRPRGMNVEAMASHPIYQSIIGMGWSAVPALIAQLRKKPGHWFSALHSITGANPVQPAEEGKLSKMADAWIKWGADRGYVDDLD
jgi:type I restriction enzyme M protein